MGWVRRKADKKPEHGCNLPNPNQANVSLKDLWRDSECGKLWRVGLACTHCDLYGRTSGTCVSHLVGITWRPARLWQHVRYGRRK